MEKLTVVQLRDFLRLQGLPSNGQKSKLIIRARDFAEGENLSEEDLVRRIQTGPEPGPDAQANILQDKMPLGESASRMGSRAGSRVSVQSMKAVALAKAAAIEAKISKMSEIEIVEREEMMLKQRQLEFRKRRERLTMEAKLAEARAEAAALHNYEEERGSLTSRSEVRGQEPEKYKPLKFDLEEPRNDLVPSRLPSATGNLGRIDVDNLGNESVLKTLVSCNLKGLMPSQELHKFGGDPASYFPFIRSFDSVIASKLTLDSEKLQYLEQFTEGRPNEIVRACLHLKSGGYGRARELLHKRFGNQEKIVSTYIDRVLNWPQIKGDNVEAFDEFSVMLTTCRNAILDMPYGLVELQNPKTMRLVLEKLPFGLQDRWRRVADGIINKEGRNIEFNDLVDFVEGEARVMANPLFGKQFFPHRKNNQIANKSNQVGKVSCNLTNSGKTGPTCWYCKGNHFVEGCGVLVKLSHEEKLNALRKLGLCFACLRGKHHAKNCNSRKSCETCQRSHPTLLHKNTDNDNTNDNLQVHSLDVSEIRGGVHTFISFGSSNCSGASVVPIKVKLGNKEIISRAFLDPGSSASFIKRSLLGKLGWEDSNSKLLNVPVTTIHGEKIMSCHLVPGIKISDLNGNRSLNLPPIFSVGNIPIMESNVICNSDLQKWPHLLDLDLELGHTDGDVELILGTNVPQALEPCELRKSGGDFQPYGMKTIFGWIICGINKRGDSISANRIMLNDRDILSKMLIQDYNRDFQDLASSAKGLSCEDKKWLSMVREGCKLVKGQYEIPLPFKDNIGELPITRPAAARRMEGLKRKFSEPVFASQYCKSINDMIEKGHAEAVPLKELNNTKVWYIPHFGVQHVDKPDKTRVVFDCAAQVQGKALNDLLIQGPDMMNLLLGVLLRFRCGRFAYAADIEAMFYQVKVPKVERDFLRFLWWEGGNTNGKIIEYRLTVHLFGACSSPSIANFALKRVIEDFGLGISGAACDTIMTNFYVDDCLRAENTLEDLKSNAMEVKSICKKGGFNLTKFVSSNQEFLSSLPEELLGKEMKNFINENSSPLVKTLGVLWDVMNDTLGVTIKVRNIPSTKRQLLSTIAGIYDPLGIVAPLVIEGRIIMQELIRKKLGWDEEILDDSRNEIKRWVGKISNNKFNFIPRCILAANSRGVRIYLHIFADASLVAYGAVAYFVIEFGRDARQTVFVLGKSRVSPLKTVSIPRLELSAAVVAVRMYEVIKSELKIHFEQVYFWSDSTTVLRYLRNESLRYEIFVANRVAIIRDLTDVKQWHYVPTRDNPADDMTRARMVVFRS